MLHRKIRNNYFLKFDEQFVYMKQTKNFTPYEKSVIISFDEANKNFITTFFKKMKSK